MRLSALKGAVALVSALLWMSVQASGVRPVSEVWPYEAKRLPDGKVQLSYDLTGLKAGILDTEAATELDEPSLKALAQKLPKEAKVTLDYAGVALSLEVASNRDRAAPAASFGLVSAQAIAAASPLEKTPGARILPALHPQMPKSWVSLDAALWKARHANESMLAGITLAADDGTLGLPMGAKAFWQAVLKAALERAASTEGDPKEGATLLAVQLATALKRQGVAAPAAITRAEAQNAALEDRLDAIEADKFSGATLLRSSFTAELRRIELRDRALGFPLPDSRPGKAAALTFLALLEKDAKLQAAFDALTKLRDALVGTPERDELAKWQAIATELGGATEGLNDFAEYLSRGQKSGLKMPALFASSAGPIDRQLDDNGGSGQENARDEVVIGVQEGKLKAADGPDAPWASVFDAALSGAILPPASSDKPQLTRSRMYRDRVSTSFIAALPAPANEVEADGADDNPASDMRPFGMKIALKVPPVFAAEPSPQLFARLSRAFERFEKVLAATGKAGTVSGVLPGGARRSANNRTEAQKLKRLFRGLELHAAGQVASVPEDKDSAKVADGFVSQWRTDPDLAADVRFASELRGGGQLLVYGVTRQEVRVQWEGTPKVAIASKEGLDALIVDTDAAQHYLTPVLMTGQPNYPGTLPDRATFKAISDRAKRDPSAVDASLAPGP